MSVKLQLLNTRILRTEIEPAVRSLLSGGTPGAMLALLYRVAAVALPDDSAPDATDASCGVRMSEIRGDIEIIEGRRSYSVSGVSSELPEAARTSPEDLAVLVREQIVPMLLTCLCLERNGVNPNQDMTHTPLIGYLYDHSKWVEGIFTFVAGITGGTFSPSPGESSQRLSAEEVIHFWHELASMPPPSTPGMRFEFENVRRMVSLAKDNADLALLVTIS
jgi:hypothetical protein